ncbi:MAG: hypothetical protein HYX25_04195 [Candidatus Solibacter usitatus]|nr:hypothetical protein [Candidatus Solibacter usitatus]
MKDNSIVWLCVGGVLFWLAILNPGPTGKVLTASKRVWDSMVSQVRLPSAPPAKRAGS